MHHLPHLPPSCPSRSSQGAELSSLRSIGTSPQLSILYLIVYICGCHFLHSFTSFLPLVSTNPFSSLCLHCLPVISSLIPFSRFHKCVNIQYWFSLSDFTLYNRTNIYWAFFLSEMHLTKDLSETKGNYPRTGRRMCWGASKKDIPQVCLPEGQLCPQQNSGSDTENKTMV